MHFAAVAYVGESTLDPLRFDFALSVSYNFLFCGRSLLIWFVYYRYYHNITSNTLIVLEAMAAHGVKTLIYSSTCATYGEPEKMPITEETLQVSTNSGNCFFL